MVLRWSGFGAHVVVGFPTFVGGCGVVSGFCVLWVFRFCGFDFWYFLLVAVCVSSIWCLFACVFELVV